MNKHWVMNMNDGKVKKKVAFLVTIIIVMSALAVAIIYLEFEKEEKEEIEGEPVLPEGVKIISKSFVFSTPEIEEYKVYGKCPAFLEVPDEYPSLQFLRHRGQ